MGNLYSCCRGFVLALVFLIPCFAFAQSVPPSIVQHDALEGKRCVGTQIHNDLSGACEYAFDTYSHTAGYTWTFQASEPSTCVIYRNSSYWQGYTCVTAVYCTDGSAPSYGKCNVQVCPAGYKMNSTGTMCDPLPVCPTNTVWNEISQTCRCENGSDVGDDGSCCPQPGEALAVMQKCEVYSTDATNCASSDNNGCAIRCNKVQFQIPPNTTGGDGVQIIDGIPALGEMCKYTGSKANEWDRVGGPLPDDEHAHEDDQTKPKPPPKTPEGCMAAGMGYVTSSSGSVTCVKSGTAGEVKSNSKGSGSESGTGPDGPKPGSNTESSKSQSKGPGGQTSSKETVTTTNSDGSRTTKTTETKCVNGNCEKIVTTETKDPNGNTVETDTKKESGDKEDFCLKNPNDVACKKTESKFSGECDTGFACEGDAATCAIAQASWKTNCDSNRRTEINDLGDSVIAGTDGKTVEDVPALNVTLQQLPGDGPGGACPSLPPIMGQYVDTSDVCGVLQGLGNAGVALALLTAGFIIVGGVRGL